MKSFLQNNDIEMYLTHNEEKYVIAERLIITLKNKIYKYMISISNYVYTDKLDEIVNKYNNTYHRTIKMKPVDVKSNTYINSSKEINDKEYKFKTVDFVGMSKYKNIFGKGYIFAIGLKKFLQLKKLKTLCREYFISDLIGKEIFGTFYEKEVQNTNQKEFKVDKAIKTKGDKLYIKWKGYDNSFNSWIDKRDII